MKITRVTLWKVALISHVAYYMADGKVCDTVESIILRVDTDAKISGWGEVCPIPHYLPAYAGGVASALAELSPVFLGANPLGVEALMTKLNACLQGHEYAKSPLDIACWDITAQVAGMPLYRLLGGRQAQDMPLYHSISCLSPDVMARFAKEAQAQGITQFQVKLGADNNIEADIARLCLTREAVGAGALVYGDWNCGATQLVATRVGRAARHLDIMLEQPCATVNRMRGRARRYWITDEDR